jgi:hypothetical protein
LFAEQLNERAFLERITGEFVERSESKTNKVDIAKIHRMRKNLEEKRGRMLDAYFEKLITRTELDRRLAQVKANQRFCDQKLSNLQPEISDISAEQLASVLAPLREWMFLSRSDKRKLLRTIVPEIHILNYHITRLGVLVQEPHRDEMNHTDMDSSPQPA